MRREQVHMMLDLVLDMGQRLLDRQGPPPEARQHFKAAGRETLLGVRAMADVAIKRMDEQLNETPNAPTGPRAIKIE